MDYKLKQSYAPFGSVATKSSKNKKNSAILPGPGAYEINLPMIAPIVQTIKKSNDNVIIKLGHIGTAAFLAGGERFKDEDNYKNIGPGACNYLFVRRRKQPGAEEFISINKEIKEISSREIKVAY